MSVTTPHGEITLERLADGARWVGTVPEHLPDGFVRIGVGAAWDSGDQHFEAGQRVRRGTVVSLRF